MTIDAEDHKTTDAGLRIATALRSRLPVRSAACCRRRCAAPRPTCANSPRQASRVRLCKGAYAEPVSEAFDARHDVDKSFAAACAILMSGPGYPMIATHDPRLIDITRSLGLAPAPGQLRAPDAVRGHARTSSGGWPRQAPQVRVYVPYGSDWYRYLVRRLAERPANLALLPAFAMVECHDRDTWRGEDGRGAAVRAAPRGAAAGGGGRRGAPGRAGRGAARAYGVPVLTRGGSGEGRETLVIAVKPQDMARMLDEIADLRQRRRSW